MIIVSQASASDDHNISVKKADCSDATRWHWYRVGGVRFVSDRRFDLLEPHFRDHSLSTERLRGRIRSGLESYTLLSLDKVEWADQYSATIPLAGGKVELVYQRASSLVRLIVNGVVALYADKANSCIWISNSHLSDDQLTEVVFGPVTADMLADRSVFLLHASAVKTAYGVVVFIAESGVGKSTLARHAGRHWQQLADDVVCLDARTMALDVMFPQLKITGAIGEGVEPNMLGLTPSLILRLEQTASEEIRFSRMTQTESVLELIRHTVGARLFESTQLTSQLNFSTRLAETIPSYRCAYPRDYSSLSELHTRIIELASGVTNESSPQSIS